MSKLLSISLIEETVCVQVGHIFYKTVIDFDVHFRFIDLHYGGGDTNRQTRGTSSVDICDLICVI